MRLLLVEDDRMLGATVERALRQQGHAVDWVHDGPAAEEAISGEPYELVLLDLGLPRKGGLEVLRDLRRRGRQVPVLILTAQDAVTDRVVGLDAGADDYLTKPFDLDELAARIRALQRRRAGRAAPVLEHGRLVLDPASHEVRLDGNPVVLSAREFEILQALLEHPGRPLSRSRLEERLYGSGQQVESNAVEVHVHALRKKLGPGWIMTLRGVGYVVPRKS
jgi:two-component system response regulator QseB